MKRLLTIENVRDRRQSISLEFDMEPQDDPAPWVTLAAKKFREKYPMVPFCDKDIRMENAFHR